MPKCWIISGPNGAGKTTFALEYLPKVASCFHFINADLIAAGLSPLTPERNLIAASRLFIREIENCIIKGEDFAFETTLSGRSYLNLVKRLQKHGWEVELIYLALPSLEMSKMRVLERVVHGGHNIPAKDIERRFPRSLHNLLVNFSFTVNNCVCFMNESKQPVLVFEQTGVIRSVIHNEYFKLLKEKAGL